MNKYISIIGLGWLGLPTGIELKKRGYKVSGSSTRNEIATQIESKHSIPCSPLTLPLNKDLEKQNKTLNDTSSSISTEKTLFNADTYIITVPFKRNLEDPNTYIEWLSSLIPHIKNDAKVIFTSSTSIYPDRDSPWTEDSEMTPSSKRAKVLKKAEDLWLNNFDATICRFGGLIGPHRNLERKLKEETLFDQPDTRLNLIHLNDCVSILCKIIETDTWGEILNCVASNPPTRRDYYTHIAHSLGLSAPKFKYERSSQNKKSGKIISNQKLLKLFPDIFTYPNILDATL